MKLKMTLSLQNKLGNQAIEILLKHASESKDNILKVDILYEKNELRIDNKKYMVYTNLENDIAFYIIRFDTFIGVTQVITSEKNDAEKHLDK